MVKTGLDNLRDRGFDSLQGRRIGVLCHQASIAADLRHILDLFDEAGVLPKKIFGPQHGLSGHTQDNMIEWEGFKEPYFDVPVYSLYGEHREPTDEMLHGLDVLVVDLQDVGARYYTFIWTMALCMKACERNGIEMLVLDRPNPIGGIQKEGPAQEDGYLSFVGLHPLSIRHGMTIGEIAQHLQTTYYPKLRLQIESMQGWERSMYFEETGLPWVMPSPNMPTVDTAVVYPGACLLEATNISEGRGTTKPFEMVGAPFIYDRRLARKMNDRELPGVYFRPVTFQPTSNKFAGEECGGVFVHVTDRQVFRPVLTYCTLIQEIWNGQDGPVWKKPPYEYEYEKMPIDILFGSPRLREAIDAGQFDEKVLQSR